MTASLLALEQLQAKGKRPLIRQVALACGHQDLSHFCADFALLQAGRRRATRGVHVTRR